VAAGPTDAEWNPAAPSCTLLPKQSQPKPCSTATHACRRSSASQREARPSPAFISWAPSWKRSPKGLPKGLSPCQKGHGPPRLLSDGQGMLWRAPAQEPHRKLLQPGPPPCTGCVLLIIHQHLRMEDVPSLQGPSLRKAALLSPWAAHAVPGGTPRCKPTPPTDASTDSSTDTHEERPFGARSDGSAGDDGPAAWRSPRPRMPAGALSTAQALGKAPAVPLCPYQSARDPAELVEDVPHHIPFLTALGARAQQLPDELHNCCLHLPGETVVTTLLVNTFAWEPP